jgi:glycerol-3-phosphate dehydrogenase
MAIPMEQKPADEKDMAQRVDQFDAIVIGAGVTGLY